MTVYVRYKNRSKPDDALPWRNDAKNAIPLPETPTALSEKLRELKAAGAKELYFPEFKPFLRKRDRLQALADSGLIFEFGDYSALGQENIQLIIKLYDVDREERRTAIIAGMQNTSGNQQITGKAKNVDLIGASKSKAARRRRFKSLVNDSNLRLRNRFLEIQGEETNMSELARKLNERNIATPRGKKHSAKSVERLMNGNNELVNSFKNGSKSLSTAEVDNEGADLPNGQGIRFPGLKDEHQNYENILQFDIESDQKEVIQIALFDNEGDIIIDKTLPEGMTVVSIDFEQEAIPPGLYYLSIYRNAELEPELLIDKRPLYIYLSYLPEKLREQIPGLNPSVVEIA